MVQTTLKNESLQTVSVTSPAYIDNKLNEWEIVKILMQKYIRWVKSYCTLKMFVLLWLKIVLLGKNIERTTNSKCQSYTKILVPIILTSLVEKFLKPEGLKWVLLY